MAAQSNGAVLGRGAARAMTALAVAYPLIAHVAVLSGSARLIAASITLLVLVILFPGLRLGRPWAWAGLAAACLGLYAAADRAQVLLLLFLPPILINVLMAWVFGHTLRRDDTSLIERIIRKLHGDPSSLDTEIATYARRLTWVWTCLFAVMASINLALAALARPGGLLLAAGLDPPFTVSLSTWSLFANVLNYLIVGALFVVEYWLRRRRFPQQSYRGFFDFARRLAGVSDMFRPASSGFQPPPSPDMRKP